MNQTRRSNEMRDDGNPNPNSNADSEANENAANEGSGFWRDVFDSIGFWFTENWLVSLLVGLAAATVVAELNDMFPINRHWKLCIAIIVLVDALVVVGFYVSEQRRKPAPPPRGFSVKAQTSFVSDGKNPTVLAFVYERPPGTQMVSPVSAATFVRFTNERDSTWMVGSFTVEAKSGDGPWTPITVIPVRGGTVFWAYEPEKAIEVQLDGFESVVYKKNLTAGETVHGWLLFVEPIDPKTTTLRMRVEDTRGNRFTEEFTLLVTPGNSFDVPAQAADMFVTGKGKRDITQLPIKPYER